MSTRSSLFPLAVRSAGIAVVWLGAAWFAFWDRFCLADACEVGSATGWKIPVVLVAAGVATGLWAAGRIRPAALTTAAILVAGLLAFFA